ncbi:vWA domain-containing protein [Sansalvadorimonas verongulae]|uniref:vWA domain-containing protein n=1 Tax=Sansalvadorimonas verongulae TaxID=2172824 RepID=UPI0012BD0FEA|nr:vWA domain-containing protein [Sansalvadorimonas verongulae]MTI14227.1 VWA domain-containing protein [Sansalvadorimonas verongulae]
MHRSAFYVAVLLVSLSATLPLKILANEEKGGYYWNPTLLFSSQPHQTIGSDSPQSTLYPGTNTGASANLWLPSPLQKLNAFIEDPDKSQGIQKVLHDNGGGQWLAYRLRVLSNYEVEFVIDNRYSMATPDGMYGPDRRQMTRFEELKFRLGNMVRLLTYLPIRKITLRTFNSAPVEFSYAQNERPDQLYHAIHQFIQTIVLDHSSTPLNGILHSLMQSSPAPKVIYLFTDGEPNDAGGTDEFCRRVTERNPEKFPLCIIACTGDDDCMKWLNKLDRKAARVHVVDDPQSEREEIKKVQGNQFPVSESFLLLSALLGPVDPLFDKADENYIFTRNEFEEIRGEKVTDQVYQKYRREAGSLQFDKDQAEAMECTIM